MGIEDRFKKQIDQLGKVLGRILADLLDIKTQENSVADLEPFYASLKSEVDLDVEEMLDIPAESLPEKLVAEKQYSLSDLELLADIFYHLDNGTDETRRTELLERAVAIYEYVQGHEHAFSMERMNKISRIRNYLGY